MKKEMDCGNVELFKAISEILVQLADKYGEELFDKNLSVSEAQDKKNWKEFSFIFDGKEYKIQNTVSNNELSTILSLSQQISTWILRK